MRRASHHMRTENHQTRTENHQTRTDNHHMRTESRQMRTENRQMRTESHQMRTENHQIPTHSLFTLSIAVVGQTARRGISQAGQAKSHGLHLRSEPTPLAVHVCIRSAATNAIY
eukprot:7735384-Pyramimonas_sp.AAC.1